MGVDAYQGANVTLYAIDYVLGASTRVLVVKAEDRDDAFDRARTELRARRFFSASIQGTARPASQDDIDRAELE